MLLTCYAGFDRGSDLLPSLKEIIMDRAIPFAAANDITVVIATGNNAPDPLDTFTPQNLGTPDNALVTVGGVDVHGVLYTYTTPDLGNGGSITIYAAAVDVKVATTNNDFGRETGTSLAAPAVAGMAAYFFSISQLDSLWPKGQVARAMKEFFIVSATVWRNNDPVPDDDELGYEGPSPDSIEVAWNRHPVGFEGCGATSSKKKRQDDLPDVSCPDDSAEDPEPTAEPETDAPTTTDPPAETATACTLVYDDGSTCIDTPDANCQPAPTIQCPLGLKPRGAHPATIYAKDATETFMATVPTNIGLETAWNGM